MIFFVEMSQKNICARDDGDDLALARFYEKPRLVVNADDRHSAAAFSETDGEPRRE